MLRLDLTVERPVEERFMERKVVVLVIRRSRMPLKTGREATTTAKVTSTASQAKSW